MNANTLRRLNWLWKHRHTHDGEDFQEQISIIRQTVEQQSDGIAAAGSGAYIHLSATGQSIAAGGEDVEWEQVDSLGVFEFNPTFPTTTVEVIKSGYYNLAPSIIEWEMWDWVGGSVSIWRNDTKVWPPLGDTAWSSGVRARWHPDSSHAVWFDHGDTFRLFVDHGSGSAQSLAHVALSAYLVDRRTDSPPWELVFPADNYGITHDDTNWWSTLGEGAGKDNVNPALFRRNAAGTILNSYDGYDDAANASPFTGPNRNRGIVYADGFLWGVGNEEAVHKIDPATGAEVSKFATVTTLLDDGRRDIAYNGTNLFVTERFSHQRVEEYTLAGAHVQNFAYPTGRSLQGLTWDGSSFWASLHDSSTIIRLNASFVEQEAIQGPTADNRGLHYRDGFLYVMTATGLYRRAV